MVLLKTNDISKRQINTTQQQMIRIDQIITDIWVLRYGKH